MGSATRCVVTLCAALLGGACARRIETPPSPPTPQRSERAEERQRLANLAAHSMTLYCDLLLEETVNQPRKVLELTENPEQTYPGIEGATAYPFVFYQRLRAAYLICADEHGDLEQATKVLPVVEECWKKLKGAREFKYLANACKMAALAHATLARRLDKARRGPEAAAVHDRGVDFYVELLDTAPKQSLATYRYVLYQLDKRVRERPNSADRRKLLEVARKAAALFGKEAKEADEILKRLAPEP